jgi:hypothetical protein
MYVPTGLESSTQISTRPEYPFPLPENPLVSNECVSDAGAMMALVVESLHAEIPTKPATDAAANAARALFHETT